MAAEETTYEIQGKTVGFPVEVRNATSGAATFLVPTKAAARLVPEEFEIAELLPGRGICSLAMVDYKDNDLGDYNEMAIGFMVYPRDEGPRIPYIGTLMDLIGGRLDSHIIHMPVDQSFTRDAGATIWGYPKTIQEIEIETFGNHARATLIYDGEHALTLTLPRGGNRTIEQGRLSTLSVIEGVPHRTSAEQRIEGMGIRFGGAQVELGTGRIAAELRTLGMPKRALMCVWMEKMTARFAPPEKL
jgi:Acetoacetate decarboxylase (ADC)